MKLYSLLLKTIFLLLKQTTAYKVFQIPPSADPTEETAGQRHIAKAIKEVSFFPLSQLFPHHHQHLVSPASQCRQKKKRKHTAMVSYLVPDVRDESVSSNFPFFSHVTPAPFSHEGLLVHHCYEGKEKSSVET